jgi:hypothetical protein
MWVVTRENHLGLNPVQIQLHQARRRHPVHQARRQARRQALRQALRQVHILRFHH